MKYCEEYEYILYPLNVFLYQSQDKDIIQNDLVHFWWKNKFSLFCQQMGSFDENDKKSCNWIVIKLLWWKIIDPKLKTS